MLRSRRDSQKVAQAAATALTADERVANLEQENQRLRDLLAEQAEQGATRSGYVCKYRGHSTASLWTPTWERRYVILKGALLTYFRSERDVQFPPRGRVDLRGACVELEGLKRRRHWTFHVVDKQGVSLIRLSTEVQSDFNAWIEALEQAGCTIKNVEESLSQGSQQSHLNQGDSPTASQVSDSDTAAYRGRVPFASSGSHPSTLGSQEVDSSGTTPLQERKSQEQSQQGYTSDTSDIGRPPPQRPNHKHKGGHKRRETMGASAPVHMAPRASLLSSERIRLLNQSGVVTLVFIILAAANFRLILENIMKYGLRFNPFSFLKNAITPSGNTPLVLCWPLLAFFALSALAIERFAVRLLDMERRAAAATDKRSVGYTEMNKAAARRASATEHLVFVLNLLNTTAALLAPCAIILHTCAELMPGFALTMATCVLWLKLVSYAHVNFDYRVARRRGETRPGERGSGQYPENVEQELRYPENIALGNLAYFLAAPTLCYQITYPRSKRFRARWMVKKLFMFTGGLGLMLFVTEQYIQPTIDNSMRPLKEMDWLRMLERILKLSIPTLYWWLAMFYTLFDLWLNILAEVLRFGDREFYKEWWNATTVGEYWRLWNQPVHKWMLRHVYFPLLRHKVPKFYAGFAVFFISAVFHEVLVGVPLHMVRLWAFWGLMAQVPLMIVTEWLKNKLKNDRIGNIVFWISFCFVGQPLAMTLYYHDHLQGYKHPFQGTPII